MNATTAAHPSERLLVELFGEEHAVVRQGKLLAGTASVDGQTVTVIGTTDQAHIGVDLALAMSRRVLDTMRSAPGRPIVLIVDNSGQRLSRWDELMGNNGCIAHLTKCLDAARRGGHRVIGLVHTLAISGGFMATGMATGACYALPDAELRLMAPSAMSRVTRIPEERLVELSRSLPVLGPGVVNFVRIGGLHGVFADDLRAELAKALSHVDAEDDPRRRLGAERGGRPHALEIAVAVRSGVVA
ncbi:biotin-independent malonate decarboxylase subunit gamma [Pseudazoarcus pumilus]|uniref:Biotin-independent malonate decarboxylase subunit gamma n=1 Tax=Pseudazoarcus pumilus TaxID=2067960 RepID=A0A2I6SA55_9RHOO|nr:biotin-independent malonate decarboxylase subunit gamma [Pseudazoarcus pumilus]AUN96143.1 biotin-independent malonate decarboxylase subunit gamma [Pseudazoarcus pumilus]